MKTAIFGDVHGNLPAFEIFLNESKDEVDAYLCLGDLVNYGPWSNECVKIAKSLPNVQFVMGNHEELFLNSDLLYKEPSLVQEFYRCTFPEFTEFESIKKFPKNLIFNSFKVSHTIGEERIYPDTKIELKDNWIVGHSHHQFLYKYGEYTLFNPGSIGQNRARINRIEWLVYDSVNGKFEFRYKLYDPSPLLSKMREKKYSFECINYYLKKLNSQSNTK